jgi:GPH family glycoside/pentoside/hexuronide:cation symporter
MAAKKSAEKVERSEDRMSFTSLTIFSLPAVIQSLLFVPVMAVFPTLYEKYYAVSFAAIGAVVTLSRGLDSFVDPVVAYLSDRTHTRIGPRKPWLIGGGALGVVAIYFLFLPPVKPGAIYFLVWSSAVYLAWSIMQVPHDAWATEISSGYDERSRIFTYKGVAGSIGSFAFLALPIVLQKYFGFATTEMTPGVMKIAGMVSIIALPLSLAAAVILVPKAKVISFQEINFFQTLKSVATNGPYQLFLLIFGIQGLALGIYAAMLFPYAEGFLKIGQDFPFIMAVTAVTAVISMPFWLWAAKKFGKHPAWAWGSFLTNVVLLGWLFVKPGQSAVMPSLIISALYGFFCSCATVCYPAIVADINDYGVLKSGASRAGTFFAGVALLVKLTSAIGGGIALMMVGWFGFTTKTDAVMTDFTRYGVQFTFLGLHTTLQLIAVWFILKFPLSKKKHAIIRKRLDQKAARLAGADLGLPGVMMGATGIGLPDPTEPTPSS